MKTFDEDYIRGLVYSNTFQETSDEIECFIKGAIWWEKERTKIMDEYEQNILNGN